MRPAASGSYRARLLPSHRDWGTEARSSGGGTNIRFLAGMRGAPRGQGHPGIWPWAAGHLANIGSRLRRPGLGPTWDEGSEEPGWSLVKERVFVTI